MGNCCGGGRPETRDNLQNPLLSDTDKLPEGAQVLQVTLHDAQNVMSADMNGKSDPYVRLKVTPDQRVGPQEFKSTHKGATLNPSWEPPERFNFIIANPKGARVILSLYDFDVVGKDESLGDAFFLVNELVNQKGPVRKALRMNGSNGQKLQTVINIDVELMSVEKVTSTKQQEVYEYERWQPVVGWGKDFPGHLLPTDPGAFNSSDGTKWSSTFDEVAPAIPAGYVETKPWQFLATAADSGGWEYSYDFVANKWFSESAPATNVRRRVWFREVCRDV